MKQLEHKIIKQYFSFDTNNGGTIQLNLMKWGDNKEKLDLRHWKKDRPQKGITLTYEELNDLIYHINNDLDDSSFKNIVTQLESFSFPYVKNALYYIVENSLLRIWISKISLLDYKNAKVEITIENSSDDEIVFDFCDYYINGKVHMVDYPKTINANEVSSLEFELGLDPACGDRIDTISINPKVNDTFFTDEEGYNIWTEVIINYDTMGRVEDAAICKLKE